MPTLEQARETILAALSALSAEVIPTESALGRVAAVSVVATEDLVPFARSAMDGFAVRAVDTRGASLGRPCELRVQGTLFAGTGNAILEETAAIAISTGAPLPSGADAVIPIEHVQHSDHAIQVHAPAAAGDSVFPAGEDVREGDVLVARGKALRPAALALLAFAGNAEVSVYQRPRVSVLATGNELVEITAKPKHGQIRNSNGPALCALAAEAGGEPRIAGVAPDDPAKLSALLEAARRDADLVVTIGGASHGQRDYVKAALSDLGAEFFFREVAMRPGRPTGFAMWAGVPVFVLPGNPAAAFVGFHQLVRPALTRLGGHAGVTAPRLPATLRGEVHGRPGMEYVVFAKATLGANGFEAEPLANQCSALVRNAAEANAFIFMPSDAPERSPGAKVEIEILDWRSVASGAAMRKKSAEYEAPFAGT